MAGSNKMDIVGGVGGRKSPGAGAGVSGSPGAKIDASESMSFPLCGRFAVHYARQQRAERSWAPGRRVCAAQAHSTQSLASVGQGALG